MRIAAKLLIIAVSFVATTVRGHARAQQFDTIHDQDIKVLTFEKVSYPLIARGAHIQGAVIVRVKMDDKGHVVDATAISGPELLISGALENIRKWQFQPNIQKAAIVVYDFQIQGGCKAGKDIDRFGFRRPNVAIVTGCQPTVQP